MAGNKQAKNQKCSYRDPFFGRQRNRAISAKFNDYCFVPRIYALWQVRRGYDVRFCFDLKYGGRCGKSTG